MKVAALIAALQAMPQDLDVHMTDTGDEDLGAVAGVEQGTAIAEDAEGGEDEEYPVVRLLPS